ncbi:MAG: DUF6270 domain-containing protein [Brachybacterium sp.]|uniref:DUF6270 domain-containing protein n=1 Tax=Brachybacterium sp. TaxID=1891286 RepID=UPI00264A3EC3|nr:DUF6270 domain-containing protein [Brachybacterium sp.]MDN5685481.1 DUF6270 domain-containing protein [Brachybacterium sp.]
MTPQPHATPLRISVYGSCVARDSVALSGGEQSAVTAYIARQSLLSAGSDVSARYPEEASTAHRFRWRMLRADFAGDLANRLADAAPGTDVLLWDLADERGGVMEFDDGGIVTRTFDLLSEPEVWPSAESGRHIAFGTDEHFALWAPRAQEFVAQLKELDLFDRTRVLRIPWALVTVDGEPAPGSLGNSPAEANALYERYYEHLESLGLDCLSVDPEILVADPNHRWGLAPFHYTQAVYDSVMDQVFASAGRARDPEPSPVAPTRVTICGSPVARDVVDLAGRTTMQLNDHILRTSLLSIGTDAAALFPQEVTGLSRPLLRTMQIDFAGRLPSFIRATAERTDLLLWDLCDERDGVTVLPDGTVITRSVDALDIPELSTIHALGAHVAFGTREHFDAWTGQARRFQRVLKGAGVLEKTLVLDVPWATSTVDGEEIASSGGLTAAEANGQFRPYLDFLDGIGFRRVTLSPDEVHADPGHRWGPAPYHYTQDVYELIIERARAAIESD